MLRDGPGVRSVSLCSCTGYPTNPDWLAAQAGVAPDELMTPVPVAGLNHCAGVTELRLRDGTDAMPLVRARTEDEVVRWAIDTFGVMPYCWAHWVEFFPQLQRLDEPYGGRAQGLAMRYGRRIYDMDDQRERHRAGAISPSAGATRRTGPRRASPTAARPRGRGHRRRRRHAVGRREPGRPVHRERHERRLIANLPAPRVEVPAIVDGQGVHPLAVGRRPGLAAQLDLHARSRR